MTKTRTVSGGLGLASLYDIRAGIAKALAKGRRGPADSGRCHKLVTI